MKKKQIANETLSILYNKSYSCNGKTIDISREINRTLSNTKYYDPKELEIIANHELINTGIETEYSIINKPTVDTIMNFVNSNICGETMCLNFASAKNPGGGFLNGAEAQEESIARASALYLSQKNAPEFYQNHRNMSSCKYSDAMIYSPSVIFIRNDNGELQDNPILCNIITCAAVNAGVVKRNEKYEDEEIKNYMMQRADKLLALANYHKNKVLILGAWGCGVFKNNPYDIGRIFAELLDKKYRNIFTNVIFSVYTRDNNLYDDFKAGLISLLPIKEISQNI